jgi:hypothetical protein
MNLHSLIGESIFNQLKDIEKHDKITYEDPVTFHCYWNKEIGTNQMFSILSCYLTNVKNTNNKIILWGESDIDSYLENPIYKIIKRYCEIKHFDHLSERIGTPLEGHILQKEFMSIPAFYSDYLRLILLYKYGGMWFDLDIMFFKKFDYLFNTYDNFMPTWERTNYPNNAIFWSRNNSIIEDLINLFLKHGCGHFGMQDTFNNRNENQKHFNFDSDLKINVLPCGWFDSLWIDNPCDFDTWFKDNNNEYFYDDAYCYHWHNRNHLQIEKNSPFHRRIKIIVDELNLHDIIKI